MKPFDPQTYLSCVEEFHRAFQYRYPTPTVPMFDKETVELRIRLLTEENNELQFAESNVAMLDAFCDLQYVLSGAILALGLRKSFEREWKRAEQSCGTLRMDICIHWFGINLLSGESTDACAIDCVLMQNALLDKVLRAGFRDVFDDAFAEVHRSNLSKLWTVEELPHTSRIFAGKSRITKSGSKFIVQRGDGKIMKSPSYSPAQLERFCKP